GLTADGALGGFTPAAVSWWRDRTFAACISKCGFRSQAAAANHMERTTRTRPRHGNAGTPHTWQCLLCDRWHWGSMQPGDPPILPPVAPILRGLALRERAERWNQAEPGPGGQPRSRRQQRRAEQKTTSR